MFLKSIELFGFKSFAERTKIEFSDGIAALLGPNGCGKSNIVDAVKWVLGEQNTRNLRAERMENIIFNGSENRKPLNVAEVTITFANDGNLLPLEISEIAITRRLFRSGESQYFINNNQVRLKEIRELLYDTGVGKISYSIMEQGKIDQILSSKPEERRLIFEEAAGITKYRARSTDAQKKLKATEDNMKQISGIMGEMKKRYDSLKKQADIAEKYKELKGRLFEEETNLQLVLLRGYLEKRSKLQMKHDRIVKEKEKRVEKIDEINKKMEKNINFVNNLESELVDLQKKVYGLDVEKESVEKRIMMLEERIEEQDLKKKNHISRDDFISEKLERTKRQLEKISERMSAMEETLKKVEDNISVFLKDIDNYSHTLEVNRNLITDLERKNENLENTIEELRERLRAVTDDIVNKLDEGLKNIGYSAEKKIRVESELSKKLEEILKEIATTIKKADKGNGSLGDVQSMLIKIKDRFLDLKELLDRYKSYNLSFLDDFLSSEGIITLKRSIDSKIEKALSELYGNRKKLSETKENNIKIVNNLEEYKKTLTDLNIHKVKLDTEIRTMEKEKERLEQQFKEYMLQKTENEEELKSIDAAKKNLVERIKALREEIDEIGNKKSKYEKKLSILKDEITSKNQFLSDNEHKLKHEMGYLNEIQAKLEKINVEIAENETEIRNIYENYRERYSKEISDFEDRIYEIKKPASQLRNEINTLKRSITALGHVNLMALEEFNEVKERYEFLTEQHSDLAKAKKDLIELTDKIRKESEELFSDTYNKIKKNFHHVFRRLFGGGRGEIKLVDPKNVLESGVEIYVQPPGKKLENLSLLSGGERSLTAVALLFAMYMVKPSPFCILDEIDAALDESNVEQFSRILKDFAVKSQFIIITHNKKTVASASTLYGITMEESGVSKMIAIRIKNGNEVPTYA